MKYTYHVLPLVLHISSSSWPIHIQTGIPSLFKISLSTRSPIYICLHCGPFVVDTLSCLRSCSYNHTAIFDTDNNRLVVFGGRTADRKRLNDVWFLDLDKWSWHRPATDGPSPSARELAVATFWAGSMVRKRSYGMVPTLAKLHKIGKAIAFWAESMVRGAAAMLAMAANRCVRFMETKTIYLGC